MTKEEEDEVHRLVQSVGVVQLSRVMFKDMDVSEMINVIILAGRGYSVKLLTWFKYYCEVMPLFIMLFHIACMVTFASHEKEMCVWFKEKLHVSDATLNRMVARGDIPNGECKKRGHTRYFKKWDILHFIKSKRK